MRESSAGPRLAPVTRVLRDSSGVYGRAVFSAQSAHGFVALAHYLTGAQALIRSGHSQLAGTFAGPPSLPRTGRVEVAGTGYRVASFPAQRYPRGAIRVYVLIPERP